jgi:hypothetical protein
MNDFLSLIKLIRQIEALFLPLFPSGWRNPPPSYRIVMPLLKRLDRYKERFSSTDALIYLIHEEGYVAYHEKGLAMNQMSPIQMKWMRFVSTVVALTMLIALTPKANILSPWVKGSLLLGSGALLIYSAMHLSISAMWASWGLFFPILGPLTFGAAPWAMILLGLWVLVWHTPVLNERNSWRWFDWLGSLPILFFWMGINWFQTLSQWESGLVSLMLWLSVWMALLFTDRSGRISRTLQLFWASSLTAIPITIEWIRPLLKRAGIYHVSPWGWWILVTLALSLLMSEVTRRILGRSFLFRWSVVGVVFAIYAISIFLSGDRPQLGEHIDNGLSLLDFSIWPLWWIVGAGIIMGVHKTTTVLMRWVQALLPIWIFPLALLLFPLLAYYAGWFPSLVKEVGRLSVASLSAGFALGAVLLAWKRKKAPLLEWVFWGFYLLLLFQYYLSEAGKATSAYKSQTMGGWGFLLLTIWLLWLGYDALGGNLRSLGKEASGVSAVALMGAFLWLLVVLLWQSYVDRRSSIGTINYYLFMGFTFLGVPLIIYHLVLRHHLRLEPSQGVPWVWILIIGIGSVQILQGIEHYAVALFYHQTPEFIQKYLYQLHLNGVPLESSVPALVMHLSWAFAWRIGRWLVAMISLTLLVYRDNRESWSYPVLLFTTCFTSLAVGTAETIWLPWPLMPWYWLVILRPWIADTALVWNLSFLKFYVLYGLAGLIWGWFLYRWINRWRNPKPLHVDAVPISE